MMQQYQMMTVKISLYFWQILSGKLSVFFKKKKTILEYVSSFDIIWLSLKTKLFIEAIKRVQRLLCGPLMTSVSVFELPHLFCLLVLALNIFLISMEAGGSPQPRGTLQIRSQSSGIGIVSLRLTTNPTLETNKKTILCSFFWVCITVTIHVKKWTSGCRDTKFCGSLQ